MNKDRIGILGNLNESYEPHAAMNKCFRDLQEKLDFSFEWIPTESLNGDAARILDTCQGIIAGSGPYKSKVGVINGIRYARKNNIPFLGTCSGFGYAVLEIGQSIFNLDNVYHPYEGIGLQANETFLETLACCNTRMQTISFKPVAGTLTNLIYCNLEIVNEQSHCVYGVKREMIDTFKKEGMVVSGMDEAGEAKIMEYNRNDFFVITLFLPQLNSDIQNPHPLFSAFFKAAERHGKSLMQKAGR